MYLKSSSKEGQPLKLNSIKMCCSHPKFMRNQAALLFMAVHSRCKEGMRALIHLSTIIIKNSRRMRKITTVAKLQLTNKKHLQKDHTLHPNSLLCKRTLSLLTSKSYRLKRQELVKINHLSMRLVRNLMRKKL